MGPRRGAVHKFIAVAVDRQVKEYGAMATRTLPGTQYRQNLFSVSRRPWATREASRS